VVAPFLCVNRAPDRCLADGQRSKVVKYSAKLVGGGFLEVRSEGALLLTCGGTL
jgi:hypothetical protein